MATGVEIMLRSLGLGEVMDFAQRMSEDGTLDRVLEFSAKLDRHNEMLEFIARKLGYVEEAEHAELSSRPSEQIVKYVAHEPVIRQVEDERDNNALATEWNNSAGDGDDIRPSTDLGNTSPERHGSDDEPSYNGTRMPEQLGRIG